jgi:uncharacterized protein (DUF1919 family)
MSLLTYTSLIKIMKQSTRFRKQSSGKSKDLKQIYKENIADKKLNIKDTPKNRIKLQTIIIKEFRKMDKSSVVVPDKAKGAIPQVKKNLTSYGEQSDKNEAEVIAKSSLKRDWTIVSDNCFGVAYMKALNKPYESPFFSMFIYAPDYITLLENFDEYMKIKPVAQEPVSDTDKFGGKSKYRRVISKYPVLLLKGSKGVVELHFAHEKQSSNKAIQKWTSRTSRMNMDKKDMFVKMDDRDKFTVELGKRFLALKQFPHKRLFVSQKYKDSLGSKKNVVVMDYKNQGPIGTKTEKLYPIPAR